MDFVVPEYDPQIPNDPESFYEMGLDDDLAAICPSDFPCLRLDFDRPGFDSQKVPRLGISFRSLSGDVLAEVRAVAVHDIPGVIFLNKRFCREAGLVSNETLILTSASLD